MERNNVLSIYICRKGEKCAEETNKKIEAIMLEDPVRKLKMKFIDDITELYEKNNLPKPNISIDGIDCLQETTEKIKEYQTEFYKEKDELTRLQNEIEAILEIAPDKMEILKQYGVLDKSGKLVEI